MTIEKRKKEQRAKPRKRGRPETRIIKLNASPEQAARAIFSRRYTA